MSLIAMKKFIQQRKQVTKQQLCLEFSKPEWVEDWLDFWMHKGVIVKTNTTKGCQKSCTSCSLPELELFAIAD